MSASPLAVVTGGAGFIGSHMVDYLLARDYRVHVLDNLSCGRLDNLAHHQQQSRVTLDTRDIRSVPANDALFQGAREIYHFAGIGDIVPSIERPVDYMSTNVLGTVAMLEAARHQKVRKFVYAASSSCYGLATQVPTPESAPVSPQYPYALSKYQGEQAVLHWGQVYRLPVVSIRIFNAYGPRSRTSGAYGAVFGVFLAQKLAGKPFTVVGDGTQTRDFIFATDLAAAFYLAGTSERQQVIYNAGAGSPQSILTLIQHLGGGAVVHLPKRPGEPDCTWADIRQIQAELGWSPKVSLAEGVSIMLRHLDYWRQAPVWTPESIAAATQQWFAHLSTTPPAPSRASGP